MSAASPSDSNAENRRLGQRSRRSRGWVAIGSSVLLHVCAGLLLIGIVRGRRSATAPPSPPAVEIEVSVFETEGRSDAETHIPRPPPSAPRPRHVRHQPSGGSPSPAQSEGAEVPTPRSQTPETTAADVHRPPDLSFNGLAEAAKQRVAAVPNPLEDLERLLVPAPEPTGKWRALTEVRAAAEREAGAVENVRRGRAHPLHFDYLRYARELIAAEAERAGDQLSLGASETLEGWARGYLDRLREVSQAGATDMPRLGDETGGHRPDVLGAINEAEIQAAAGAARRVAHVCLGVAPDHPVVVTLRRSSGNERLDQIAMASFRSAATARPLDSDVRPGLACYLVGVSAYRMPPLPALSLGWKKGRPELIHPLKRMNKVTVELESVDYGAPKGPPSLLRRSN